MSSFSGLQIIYRVFWTVVLCFFGWVFSDRIIICDMFFFGIGFFWATKCYAYIFFGMWGFSDLSWGCGTDMLCFWNTVCFFGSAICFLGGAICLFCDNICFLGAQYFFGGRDMFFLQQHMFFSVCSFCFRNSTCFADMSLFKMHWLLRSVTTKGSHLRFHGHDRERPIGEGVYKILYPLGRRPTPSGCMAIDQSEERDSSNITLYG